MIAEKTVKGIIERPNKVNPKITLFRRAKLQENDEKS